MPVRTVSQKFIRPQWGKILKEWWSRPTTTACWKIRFKTEVCTCSHFPTEAMLWIKEVEMVDSLEELKSCFWEEFSKYRGAGREDCLSSEQNHPEFPISRNRKPRRRTGFYEKDRSPSWSTTTFEWVVPMIQYWILLIYSLLPFMTIIFRNSIQDGTKFHYPCQRFPPMISWKVCTNWEYVGPHNSKQYWICTTWRFIRTYRCPIMKNWRPWKGVQIRNFDYEILTPGTGELKHEQWSRIAREWVALKEEKVPVARGKKKASVRKETNAVSGMRVTIVPKNQTTMPPHLPSHPFHKVEVCRRKEVSKAKVTMVPFSDKRADIIWKVLACERLVNIGILPNVHFTKQKRAANPGTSVCSRIIRLMNNQTESSREATIPTKEEKTTTRMLWLL